MNNECLNLITTRRSWRRCEIRQVLKEQLDAVLAAHAVGLCSCWIHREREMFETPEGRALMKRWGLPDRLIGIGALALGYPEGKAPAAKPRKPDYIVRI